MEQTSGFLLINKPAGITSHDVVDRLRKITGIRKIGHAGTLDPFATGLLLVAVGREATREISTFVGLDKTYEAEFVLGATTETLDPEGVVIRAEQKTDQDGVMITKDQIQHAMQSLTGDIKQVPPMHSAIKVGGKKLYELARKGQEIEREPRKVTISEFVLTGNPQDSDATITLPVRIGCSSGTYIRSLARDLAETLGTVGYVIQLQRTAIGPFTLDQAVDLSDLTPENWQTKSKNLQMALVDENPGQ